MSQLFCDFGSQWGSVLFRYQCISFAEERKSHIGWTIFLCPVQCPFYLQFKMKRNIWLTICPCCCIAGCVVLCVCHGRLFYNLMWVKNKAWVFGDTSQQVLASFTAAGRLSLCFCTDRKSSLSFCSVSCPFALAWRPTLTSPLKYTHGHANMHKHVWKNHFSRTCTLCCPFIKLCVFLHGLYHVSQLMDIGSF